MDTETAWAKLEAAKQKYGSDIRVFETSKPSQPPPQVAANSEESDEFFELTPQDFYHLMATKKEDKYLKTRKIREAEEAAKRAKMTKSTIRVRFPDDHTLEAVFHPSEPLQKVFDLLSKVLARPELPYYLYTTPPKKQIKDTSQNFFAAGFVPGAVVYFSYDLPKEDEAHSGPFLQVDVIALKGLDLVSEPKQGASQPALEDEDAGPSPPVVQDRKPTEKKAVKPKWLKM